MRYTNPRLYNTYLYLFSVELSVWRRVYVTYSQDLFDKSCCNNIISISIIIIIIIIAIMAWH